MSAIPDLWHPETVYLNTASFGLPPDPVWDALQQAQTDWRARARQLGALDRGHRAGAGAVRPARRTPTPTASRSARRCPG